MAPITIALVVLAAVGLFIGSLWVGVATATALAFMVAYAVHVRRTAA